MSINEYVNRNWNIPVVFYKFEYISWKVLLYLPLTMYVISYLLPISRTKVSFAYSVDLRLNYCDIFFFLSKKVKNYRYGQTNRKNGLYIQIYRICNVCIRLNHRFLNHGQSLSLKDPELYLTNFDQHILFEYEV